VTVTDSANDFASANYTIVITNVSASAAAAETVVSALPVRPSIAQQPSSSHPHYKLIDLGTLGGPQSYVNNGNDGSTQVAVLNNKGELTGWADTSAPDPFPDFCFNEDCRVSHAFEWHAGVRTDLGALTEGLSSAASWVSASGLIVGFAENGEMDPLIPGLPEIRAVLWRNHRVTDLGTLPDEGGYESVANAVNSREQVVGWATNTVPDPNSMAAPGFLPTLNPTQKACAREHTLRYGIEEGTLVTTEPCGDGVLIRPAVVVPGRDIHQNARRGFSSPPLQLRKTTAAHAKG
jgi:hypothetical protein